MIDSLLLKVWSFIWSFQRATFYRDLADALSRKVGLRDFLQREIENARMLKMGMRGKVLQAIANRFASGDGSRLSELFAGVVPDSDLMLLASVDEAKKDRDQALLKVADAVDFQIRSLKTLGKNMLIPLIAVPIVLFMCVISADIIEKISKTAPPSIFVGFNGFIRWLATAINSYWFHSVVILVMFIAALVWILPRWTGRARLMLDNFPGFSMYRDYNTAIVLSAMSMMLSSGKTVTQAVEDMSNHAGPWLRWHLRRVLLSIEDNPNDYVTAFSLGLMSKKIQARMASLLDSSKSFDQALIALGSTEVKRLEDNVQTSASLLQFLVISVLTLIAVLLFVGQMTIIQEVQKAADPTKFISNR